MSAAATDNPAPRVITPAILALAVGLVALILLFLPEGAAAVRVWIDSTAYGHCFLVIPIAAYLAWDRRDTLRGLPPIPTPALALLGLPLPFAWLLAERLGIMEGRQLVAMGAVEVLFLTALGWRLFYALSGPLLYLLFLVPFGAFLTTPLQNFTAWFIDVGLTTLNISHVMTDMTVEISSGAFYVAEACAGLRFLIASVAFGVFFALLNYRSPGRRIAFVVASIAVPIIANGFRALGIVVLGNILGSAEAAAADHLIYGWVFFSFVMLLLVAAGLPFRESMAPHPILARPAAPRTTAPAAWPALLIIAIAALGPLAAIVFNRQATAAALTPPPTLLAPAGCSIAVTPSTQDHAIASVVCPERTWAVTIQALAARSTAAVMADAKRQLLGAVDPEETTIATLPGLPDWQVLVSREPPRMVAIASWVDGQPATGGLAQRLLQAHNSILGSTMQPLLVTIATGPGDRLTDASVQNMAQQLRAIIEAQADLLPNLARRSTVH